MREAHLTAPDLRYHRSFLGALREYHEDELRENLRDPADFARWLDDMREAGSHGTAAIERDRVRHRILWWVRDDDYLGRVRINLELNDELTEFGGHIGYDIRPSARGQGHATALLREAIGVAKEHGIVRALLTCAPDNHASRRVIERNGGVLHDLSAAGRLRYWVG
ncbi:GNAT family N-acetyltransferase [Labedaea rhizosphaerae]|uniref:Putative acetyltransferase n=1 Tax=Labedaea rhizosphaerae TaxID=598644 RepID=A0A4R6SCK7_LABRH|nr:GNAT family N-acetyltransferase [Labedaea rhizosphaerae]TDP97333.1 putative acetyltransferase [Labedaea rhizosphaerae]